MRLASHRVMPSKNVPIPSVTTIVLTPSLTTRNPFTSPTSAHAMTAAMAATHTFQWCVTVSTVTRMAPSPKFDATDKSTNSPTMMVHSRAADKNTSACWLPKMVRNAPTVRNVCGFRMLKRMIISSQTPITAKRELNHPNETEPRRRVASYMSTAPVYGSGVGAAMVALLDVLVIPTCSRFSSVCVPRDSRLREPGSHRYRAVADTRSCAKAYAHPGEINSRSRRLFAHLRQKARSRHLKNFMRTDSRSIVLADVISITLEIVCDLT